MRNAQVVFSQTKTAIWSKFATLAEKYSFRGICFILSLRWLELKGKGKSDSASIQSLQDAGKFIELWKEFELQGQNASKIMSLLKDEISNSEEAISGYDKALEIIKSTINQLPSNAVDEHIQQREALQLMRKKKKDLVLVVKGCKQQLGNMFASEEEEAFGETGTASEQLLRKIFEVTVKLNWVVDLTVKSKSIFGDTLSWTEAGKSVAEFVSVMSKGSAGQFEIGFYGSGAHSVALYAAGDGTYAFFDPNYGVFTGDGNLNKLETDVANLLKDKYSKMNKVVVSFLKPG